MTSKPKKEKTSPDKFTLVSNELYNSLCKAIQTLLKNSIKHGDITEQEIEAARGFADFRPESKATKGLLGFLAGAIILNKS